MASSTQDVKPTILIVEDDVSLRTMLKMAFERRGFAVQAAGAVAEGLSLAAGHAFDAVLADFQLPDSDGLEFCRALRQQASGAGLPIWLMTGSSLLTPAQAAEVSALGIFRKPFLVMEAARKIEGYLQDQRKKTGT